jgi:polyhydroxyalkanoate synthase subunit PhaE
MSDGKPLNDWVKGWESLQHQYLAAWSDLMQKTPAASPPPPFSMPFGNIPGVFGAGQSAGGTAPPWHEGLEQWARLFGSRGAQSETVERVVESGKAYVDMIKGMFGGMGTPAMGSANPGQAWLDAMRGGFGGPSGFSMPGMDAASSTLLNNPLLNNPFLKAVRDIAGKGAHGFGDLPAAFAPFLEQFRQENLSWLRMPAFGFAREHQEHYQRTALAFVEYQEALRNYSALLLKASQRGLELLEYKLAERSEPGRAIDSPRALYDLWVDAAEDAYAEIALSEEFGKAYGELANAQMRMRAQIQAEVERIGTDLGMPTRTELNSVHQRLHDLRREFRDSRGESSAIADLEVQIAELREEVVRLKAAVAAKAASPVAPTVKALPKPAATTAHPPAAPGNAVRAKRSKMPTKTRARTRARRSASRVKPVATTAKTPPAVVAKPVPATKSAAPKTVTPVPKSSFGDAIAAMRRRVQKSGRIKSAAAKVSLPQKAGKSEKSSRKSGKRK